MSILGPKQAAPISKAINDIAEEVFATVGVVRDDALRCHRGAVARRARLTGGDISTLRTGIQAHLQPGNGLVIGLGLILAPDLLGDQALRLEWWQWEPREAEPVALKVDLNRSSLGFYDYENAEWFDVPRRSGSRHIVGPYVDVHGTGRYMLTFTMPVQSNGQFLGVAGADVPATWLETRVLQEVGPDMDVVVLNPERRVVLSTSMDWMTGALAHPALVGERDAYLDLPGLPWQLLVDTTENLPTS